MKRARSRELGFVNWLRDCRVACRVSTETRKPLLALYARSGSRPFPLPGGGLALTHPLIIEAIESGTIPFAVPTSSHRGSSQDAPFPPSPGGEVALRVLDGNLCDILAPHPDMQHASGLVMLLMKIVAHGNQAPARYLQVLQQELQPGARQRLSFITTSIAEAQAALGANLAVLAVRPGLFEQQRVVEVALEPKADLPTFFEMAGEIRALTEVIVMDESMTEIAQSIFRGRVQTASVRPHDCQTPEHLAALRTTLVRFLPLSPLQMLRINAAMSCGQTGLDWLSPRQVLMLSEVQDALRRDPEVFNGLDVSAGHGSLGRYERELRLRLSGIFSAGRRTLSM